MAADVILQPGGHGVVVSVVAHNGVGQVGDRSRDRVDAPCIAAAV
jgi:hypothetical protein